jgi:hypothetical protein
MTDVAVNGHVAKEGDSWGLVCPIHGCTGLTGDGKGRYVCMACEGDFTDELIRVMGQEFYDAMGDPRKMREYRERRQRMVDEPILDTNDQALVGYFLRGMRRFEKFVRAQDIFGTEDIVERIERAYCEALVKFSGGEV